MREDIQEARDEDVDTKANTPGNDWCLMLGQRTTLGGNVPMLTVPGLDSPDYFLRA